MLQHRFALVRSTRFPVLKYFRVFLLVFALALILTYLVNLLQPTWLYYFVRSWFTDLTLFFLVVLLLYHFIGFLLFKRNGEVHFTDEAYHINKKGIVDTYYWTENMEVCFSRLHKNIYALQLDQVKMNVCLTKEELVALEMFLEHKGLMEDDAFPWYLKG